jgi:hypothetical protein
MRRDWDEIMRCITNRHISINEKNGFQIISLKALVVLRLEREVCLVGRLCVSQWLIQRSGVLRHVLRDVQELTWM